MLLILIRENLIDSLEQKSIPLFKSAFLKYCDSEPKFRDKIEKMDYNRVLEPNNLAGILKDITDFIEKFNLGNVF
ncbi:Uncharacterised protein [Salmonella enterica subsp. enterica serovar Typhimurium str. DT104]|nr:Uncharacterised protein [Salmonella enterica subsp. enterica serovar Typhimurium str. DT104]